MTKQQQTTENMKLLEKLTNYLAKHPQDDMNEYREVSYVLFSAENQELNKMNDQLLNTLIREGDFVIKAEQTKDVKEPWKFTTVTT